MRTELTKEVITLLSIAGKNQKDRLILDIKDLVKDWEEMPRVDFWDKYVELL